MTPKQLADIAKVCQKHGIAYYRDNEIEIKLEHKEESLPPSEAKEDKPQYTDEQIAFWSSAGIE